MTNRYISNTLGKDFTTNTFPELRHQLMTDKYPVPMVWIKKYMNVD